MDSNRRILTKSAEETQKFGQELANNLKGGETLALVGDLGSGKTTFVQGVARGLGIKGKITSPTFIILRQYDISGLGYRISDFFHADLYRLESDVGKELAKIGLTDLWGRQENVVVVEWADKAREVIPKSAMWISLERIDDTTRKIEII